MKKHFKAIVFIVYAMSRKQPGNAQTDMDAIMMGKKRFCVGTIYSNSSWKNYWEGTLNCQDR
jgi:hypothetical protein